jgi:electron transport complex protein RnfG
MLIAREGGAAKGFVVEGDTRGYKNRIRFFVALDPAFRISGVQVLEHEEDPGLGAETATPWFTRQFVGRTPSGLEGLSVTRDPLPEDWRAALFENGRGEPPAWSARHRDLVNRMDGGPIHAVTGATISSRAVTDGVRATVLHFQRRWNLLEPYLGGRS